jgi:hypothetical protein
VISLTLMTVAPWAERGAPEDRLEPREVGVPEVRPTRADKHGRIISDEVGQLPREPRPLSCIIVKVDAVLAPRLTTFD